MDVRHGFVVYVGNVLGVQADAGVRIDFVLRHQIEGGIGALREGCDGLGLGYFVAHIYNLALPVQAAAQRDAVVDVVAAEQFEQVRGIVQIDVPTFAVFGTRIGVRSVD